ncbi:MAG: VWA domain-containing protein [Deltaproteobacteria bacterium]|nr:VWA domain-containing protein [Deltaproteobacteria bacterium]
MKKILKKISLFTLLITQGLLPACSAGAKTVRETSNTILKETPQIRARASLSQSKILQGSDGVVYLQIDLDAPEYSRGFVSQRRPTDFVVVLDRSGSMSAANKMEYAHQALQTLVQQLSPEDRFGLVSFDDTAEVHHYLSPVSAVEKAQLQQKIWAINPRGNTNISAGLSSALQMIRENNSPYRSERILLISDGLANRGIVNPEALANLVSPQSVYGYGPQEQGMFSLSSIGVGLDFNEYLLSNLADHGRGSYHYLQNPSGMYNILSEEFRVASSIYASNLQLQIDLPPDISLLDASGYPISREGNHYTVQPGHLYNGQKKVIYLSLGLPNSYTYPSRPIGNMALSFYVQGIFYQTPLINSDLYVACLHPSQRYEAEESINKKVYEDSWTKNNYGRALQESAKKISEGNPQGAYKVIQDYKSKVSEANAAAPSSALAGQMNAADKIKSDMDKAYGSGKPAESLNSLGKGLHYEGIQQQR